MNKTLSNAFGFIFLMFTAVGWAAPVPDSGQAKCYDNAAEIPCPSPGEAFYGQDASYNINPMSYTKLDGGGNALPDSSVSWIMVRDNVSGLTWEIKTGKDGVKNDNDPHDADNTYTWYDPTDPNSGAHGDSTDTEAFIKALNDAFFGGYNDWRMPTYKELAYIFNCDIPNSRPAVSSDYFPDAQTFFYWSATPSAFYTNTAWGVPFHTGNTFSNGRFKGSSHYVRAVRGGQIQSSFADNDNGTVTDTATGLMWQKNAPEQLVWKQALAYCEGLNLGEHTDWRLPTKKELQSIADYNRNDPAIDTTHFPDTASSFYWSSTTNASDAHFASGVSFRNGLVLNGDKLGYYHVRAVRGGQPDCKPDVKANGQDEQLTVSSGTPVSISAGLASGNEEGKPADWWLAYSSPAGWFSLTSEGWTPGIHLLAQHPLFSISSVEVYSAPLSVGDHAFYFLVDMNPNGIVDTPFYYDSVQVQVVSSDPVPSPTPTPVPSPTPTPVPSPTPTPTPPPELVSVPDVVGAALAAAQASITSAGLSVGTITEANSITVPAGNVISQNPAAGVSVSKGTLVSLMLSLGPLGPALPPDPATIAPPLDLTIPTSIFSATEFLYTGADPIQTGVAPGTIEAKRIAVLRGKVLNRDGTSLPGVQISIHNHPEFGQTLSRSDGRFDMVVNGAGYFNVNYDKPGYLPAQRVVNVPWRDYVVLQDVVLVQLDSRVTTVDLTASIPFQVAQGNPVTDGDGTRQATLLFAQGTMASMVMRDGSTLPLTSLNVRATEYTVGANGPAAMPALLPPASGYTYAVEFSADEAISAGAVEVRFDRPVYVYVENFLIFPVGGIVPAGYYDRRKAAWIPSDNGKVIKILGIVNNMAEIDSTGDGISDNGEALGLTEAERMQLALLYVPGQSLWRVPTTHFTPWDHNWPYGPPADARPPRVTPPKRDSEDNGCVVSGSIINCQNQTLGESVKIAGTPFDLHYVSSRVPGRKTANTITVPLSDASSLPPSLRRIDLEIDVAGRRFSYEFSAAPNQSFPFTWDGKDVYGRTVSGTSPITVSIGYVYGAVYYETNQFWQAFSAFSGSGLSIAPGRRAQEIVISQIWTNIVTSIDARGYGLGSWTLNAHHIYDSSGRVLHLGDGTQRSAAAMNRVITTIAGTGVAGFSGDGGPATAAQLYFPYGGSIGQDGSIYIADYSNNRVRRVGPDGIITTVAGSGVRGFSGDGGPATAAAMRSPSGIAIGQDGSLYIADVGNNRIRRVGPDGIITTVAGTGVGGFTGDGGPATAAALNGPFQVAIGPDGSLYMADQSNQRIRRVGPDGIITTVVGTGVEGFSGDGGPATKAQLNWPYGIAIGQDGSLYIGDIDNRRIRRVGPDGIITTVAGTGVFGFIGDGGPATAAQLQSVSGIAMGPDDSLYFGDSSRVRRVGPDGIITTVAGTGIQGFSGDGGPATAARLSGVIRGIAIGPDDSLYIVDTSNNRIRRVEPAMPGFSYTDIIVPSESGDKIYVFNASGRHLRTLNAFTNTVIYRFDYDADGRLSQVADAYGNLTQIGRSVSGAPTAIISPFGQQTQLTVNGDGYLASISDPGNHTTSFTYASDGLMTGMTQPNGTVYAFNYSPDGRLIKDEDPAHNIQSLSRTESFSGYSVIHETAQGRQTAYSVDQLSDGSEQMVNTFPTGSVTTSRLLTNGSESLSFADGSTSAISKTPDPRFGMRSPLNKTTLKMPSYPEFITESKRTVTLSNPSDPLSVQTLTEETTFCQGCTDPRTYSLTYAAAAKKYTDTTAEGRRKEITVTDQGAIAGIDFIPGVGGISIDPIALVYNPKGLMTETALGDASLTFTYDVLGRVDSIANASGESIGYGYDPANRVITVTSPIGNNYGFNYDAGSNLTQITMPSSAAHALSYNTLNLLSGYTPPGVGQPPYAWSYNKDQDLTQAALPGGRAIDIGYDTGGRMTQILYPEATVQLSYNGVTDRLSRITRTPLSGTVQQMDYTYDGSLLKSAIYSGIANGTYTYTYDNNYFLTGFGLDSNSVAIVRDKDGLVTRYGDFSFSREKTLGLLTTIEDSGSGTHTLRIDYLYDNMGRLKSRVHQVKTGVDGGGNPIYTQIFSLQLVRDNTGRITQKNDGFINNYAYDANGQLITVKNGANTILEQYTYDANANRIRANATTAAYDEQDRILNQGGVTYQHNADGFMTQAGSDTLVYSARGELLQANVGGNNITYAYDGYGRRIGRKASSGNWYQYLYAEPQNTYPVTATRDPDGVLTTYHYDDFGHLFALQRGGAWYYVATDQVGTPRVVCNAAGTIIKTLDHDSYGVLIAESNPGFDLPIGFAGGINDRVTGLVRFGARDYDPAIGRWAAKDPIMFESGQMNLYAYVTNNPVTYTDPEGFRTKFEEKLDPILDVFDSILDTVMDTFKDTGNPRSRSIIAPTTERWYYDAVSSKSRCLFGEKYFESKQKRPDPTKTTRVDGFKLKNRHVVTGGGFLPGQYDGGGPWLLDLVHP